MAALSYHDILINARQESARMQHHFIGVEHLFIGMLDYPGSITRMLLERQGVTAQYITDAIRKYVGKGVKATFHTGTPHSERVKSITSIANDLRLEDGRNDTIERDILQAILDENDNIPVRVMTKLGVNLKELRNGLLEIASSNQIGMIQITIEYSESLNSVAITEDHHRLLRRMFLGYAKIRIERQLTNGYTSALVLVISPVRSDGLTDAPVVVKMDHSNIIYQEANRYDQYVRSALPALTARLEEKPTIDEFSQLAGLKYTFIAGADHTPPDLRVVVQEIGLESIGQWIYDQVFTQFRPMWWVNQRPYRFQVWTEYDWMLPPLLTLEYDDSIDQPEAVIRDPIRASRVQNLDYGTQVQLENFIVSKVDKDRKLIQLTPSGQNDAIQRPYKINILEVDLSKTAFYTGEPVEVITGRVEKNRDDILTLAIGALNPDFATTTPTIPGSLLIPELPNPLTRYPEILKLYITGAESRIHGDLHFGNILIGVNRSAFLIDFAQTRIGHIIFDWANLMNSFINDLLIRPLDGEWSTIRSTLDLIIAVHRKDDRAITLLSAQHSHFGACAKSMAAILEIARECLAVTDVWAEYYIALGMSAMRALTWESLPIQNRRMMFLVAGFAFHELLQRGSSGRTTPDTLSTDRTDIIDK